MDKGFDSEIAQRELSDLRRASDGSMRPMRTPPVVSVLDSGTQQSAALEAAAANPDQQPGQEPDGQIYQEHHSNTEGHRA